jgi:glycine/D-amino acid oxidase-like deaminating enzyme
MLQFNSLSFWEKQVILEDIDFLVVGAGIVGAATAFELRKLHPSAKIVLIERGYLSTGASTKNAGFACFGSVTELLDDLQQQSANSVWETIAMRYEGLQKLRERFSDKSIDYQQNGSWDLIHEKQSIVARNALQKIDFLNEEVFKITGEKACFSYSKNVAEKYGFLSIIGGFHNRLEGSIDTGKLLQETTRLLSEKSIICLYGVALNTFESHADGVILQTNFGEIKTKKMAIAVNGFAQELLGMTSVQPARAQVIVTNELTNLTLDSTFHYDCGYYYFRNVGKRILLGGGRNLDFEGETTTKFEQTTEIISALTNLLKEVIIPNQPFSIDYQWSGIMGVGSEKKPIIEKKLNYVVGVRMGGMGIAIGSKVGEDLAHLLT